MRLPRRPTLSIEPVPFELRADASCALDTCRIETELGSVEASLDAQLQRLAQRLVRRAHRSPLMNTPSLATERLLRTLQATRTVVEHGRVVQAGGTILRATGLRARIGQQCRIFDPRQRPTTARPLLAEVIGFAASEVILAPYGPAAGRGRRRCGASHGRAGASALRTGSARPRDRCLRPAARRPAAPSRARPAAHAAARRRAVAAATQGRGPPAAHRRARDRRRPHRWRGPARGHLRDGRRRQVHAAGHAGAPGQGRRQRDRAGRRTRPRGARIPRREPGRPMAWPARWWWCPPPTGRRSSACARRMRQPRSPKAFAARASACCCWSTR